MFSNGFGWQEMGLKTCLNLKHVVLHMMVICDEMIYGSIFRCDPKLEHYLGSIIRQCERPPRSFDPLKDQHPMSFGLTKLEYTFTVPAGRGCVSGSCTLQGSSL